MSKDIRIDVARARSAAVGAEHGITPSELRDIAPQIQDGHRAICKDRSSKRIGFQDLYKDSGMLKEVAAGAKAFRSSEHENLVVLGIGGSALGLTTLITALKPPYYNSLSREQREGYPRAFVMDNVDPESFEQMLKICPPEKTLYNVISKSGGTAETLSQLLIVMDVLEKALGKSAVKEHLVVTTGPVAAKGPKNALQAIQSRYGLTGFEVPENVGGRFSIFTPVGLFPAAVLGVDILALAKGCRAMDRQTSRKELNENPAYLRAAFHYIAATKKGKTSSVMMPYADSLRDVADWYRQLWAESLGKKCSTDGKNDQLYAGQTPIKALGVTDQHSQLQLYLEGPNDKIVTILEVQRLQAKLKIPDAPLKLPGAVYLRGKTMNQLLSAECRATVDALRDASRPVLRVRFPEVNAYTVAQLLYMLEVETAMAGQLFGVDAFDQPAVEAIKVFTRKYLGGKG